MTIKTKIQWADSTWNPLVAFNKETGERGHFCVPVSEECRYCYASRMNAQKAPLGTGIAFASENRSKVSLKILRKVLHAPMNRKQKTRWFVCSMTDLFLEDYPFSWIDHLFAVMEHAFWHQFLLLTKRPERMKEYLDRRWSCVRQGPPHIWTGVSVGENRHLQRVDVLMQIKSAVRWISYEPALEYIDFRPYLTSSPRVDWIVCGGESGPNARPFHLSWAKSLISVCQETGTPVFIKQLGARPVDESGKYILLSDDKGGDIEEWGDNDLRVRQYPQEEVLYGKLS